MNSPDALSRRAETASAEATQEIAHHLAAELGPGQLVALVGDLGAGKTTFVQGLAEGLKVFDCSEVVSPTYALVNEYPAPGGPLVHIDFYRLDEPETACALGIEEHLYRSDAVVAVEWADKLPELLPPHTLWIRLERLSAARRRIEIGSGAVPAAAGRGA